MDDFLISKKNINSNSKKINFFSKKIIKFLVLIIVTLLLLITLKVSVKFRSVFYKNIYERHFSFATINNYYQKLFGNPIPFNDFFKDKTKTVFNEKINYKALSKYYDGISLVVEKNMLVPVLETGMVVYVGQKENFGNTVIIEQIDGTDVWYGNLSNLNVKMYDYIEKGSVLANTKDDKLYLVFKQDGENISYEKYL